MVYPGSKCAKFLKDHPCITPYYLTGPQPEALKIVEKFRCITENHMDPLIKS